MWLIVLGKALKKLLNDVTRFSVSLFGSPLGHALLHQIHNKRARMCVYLCVCYSSLCGQQVHHRSGDNAYMSVCIRSAQGFSGYTRCFLCLDFLHYFWPQRCLFRQSASNSGSPLLAGNYLGKRRPTQTTLRLYKPANLDPKRENSPIPGHRQTCGIWGEDRSRRRIKAKLRSPVRGKRLRESPPGCRCPNPRIHPWG